MVLRRILCCCTRCWQWRAVPGSGRGWSGGIRLAPKILSYIVDLIRATREDPDIRHGTSTHAGDALAAAVRVRAAIEGRDYGLPDDLQPLLLPVPQHRIEPGPRAEIDGGAADEVLGAVLARTDAPR